MNAPATTGIAWWESVRSGWDAVPARDILDPVAGHFTVNGFNAVSEAEIITFAAMARLFKHGQSIAMLLPTAGADCLLHLAYYLHRLRLDAIDDLIRAPWLNQHEMAARPHLVVLTRPLIRHHQLAREPQLHASILRPATPPQILGQERLATLLIDPTKDLSQAIDAILTKTRPFAFVIDATPAGLGDDAHRLYQAFAREFRTVPRLTIGCLGDSAVTPLLAASADVGHCWQMRLGDIGLSEQAILARPATPVEAVASARKIIITRAGRKVVVPTPPAPAQMALDQPRRVELGIVADAITDSVLKQASMALYALRTASQTEPIALRTAQLSPLSKVFNALRSRFVPLSDLEEHLTGATHGGRFPARSLQRWMERAGDFQFQYGHTQSAHAAAKTAVQAAYDHAGQAQTGREQAVLALLERFCQQGKRVGILVETEMDAKLLHAHLDRHFDSDLHAHLVVQAMDHSRDNAFGAQRFDHVLLVGILWPSRMHWLAVDTQHLLILCYPFDQVLAERHVQLWWAANGMRSVAHGDKSRLWQLDFARGRCVDGHVEVSDVPVGVTTLAYSGVHPKGTKAVVIDAPDRNDDWMEFLMSPVPEIETDASDASTDQDPAQAHGDIVWVHLENQSKPMPWPASRTALILQRDEFVSRLPKDLQAGDRVILLVNNDERVASLERLFVLFVEQSTGLEQFVTIARKWQTFIDMASRKLTTVKALREKFKVNGVTVTEATIRSWIAHQVIGPDDPNAILIMARYLEMKSPEKLSAHIQRSVERVRTEHRRIGRDLTAAIVARSRGADQVRIGNLRMDVTALDEMVEIGTVLSVTMPPLAEAPAQLSLTEVADQVCAAFPDRLLFTPAARRSLQACVFRDVEHLRQCLILMSTQLHDMYILKRGRMPDVLMAFSLKNITFAAKMAETTQGRFDVYKRQYQGQRVDIGKHFRLGSNFDPTRTMRIHYHVAPDENLIVIHHAGVHLPTNAD